MPPAAPTPQHVNKPVLCVIQYKLIDRQAYNACVAEATTRAARGGRGKLNKQFKGIFRGNNNELVLLVF